MNDVVILSMNGMNFVKMRYGTNELIFLIDTGATISVQATPAYKVEAGSEVITFAGTGILRDETNVSSTSAAVGTGATFDVTVQLSMPLVAIATNPADDNDATPASVTSTITATSTSVATMDLFMYKAAGSCPSE